MQLCRLVHYLQSRQVVEVQHFADVAVTGLAYDSRQVQPGDLFVAWKGFTTDGHRYIPQALERGAVAVVAERALELARPVPLLVTPNARSALAHLAACFYDFPSRRLGLIGVTGTDGKTTTTTLVAHLLGIAGFPTGMATTAQFKIGPYWSDNLTRQSTLESLDVQRLLARMVEAGVRYAALEATSHALALDRLVDCAFDVAVLTNVTHEHLDFHGTIEKYVAAKARLFRMVGETPCKGIPRACVINADDTHADAFRAAAAAPVVTYSLRGAADVRAHTIRLSGRGTQFTLESPWGRAEVTTPYVGEFNVANCLAALAACAALGAPLDALVRGLARAPRVPGRMELVQAGQPFTVVVDYAHTADSLEKVLTVLRPLTPGRLIAVFGSAGQRDVAKRPAMGAVAARHADFFVLTDEDPRFEDREQILRDIAAGAAQAGARQGMHFVCIPDRRAAIEEAMRRARPGDTVLLAGKGHEQCIIYGDQKMPWDERRVAREILERLFPPAAGIDTPAEARLS